MKLVSILIFYSTVLLAEHETIKQIGSQRAPQESLESKYSNALENLNSCLMEKQELIKKVNTVNSKASDFKCEAECHEDAGSKSNYSWSQRGNVSAKSDSPQHAFLKLLEECKNKRTNSTYAYRVVVHNSIATVETACYPVFEK